MKRVAAGGRRAGGGHPDCWCTFVLKHLLSFSSLLIVHMIIVSLIHGCLLHFHAFLLLFIIVCNMIVQVDCIKLAN